jgi:hypothetical protein
MSLQLGKHHLPPTSNYQCMMKFGIWTVEWPFQVDQLSTLRDLQILFLKIKVLMEKLLTLDLLETMKEAQH